MAKLSEVLTRNHLASKLAAKRSSVHEAIATYAAQVVHVTPTEVPRAVPRDADDDQVLACAVAANAGLIVTGDSDLLSLGSDYQGIQIMTAAQAVAMIEAG